MPLLQIRLATLLLLPPRIQRRAPALLLPPEFSSFEADPLCVYASTTARCVRQLLL
jgi:hypothetical protein